MLRMRGSTALRGWAVCVLCLAVLPAFGQSREQIDAWLKAEWDALPSAPSPFFDLDGAGLCYVVERYVEGEELVALQRRVEGHPDHPDRTLLEDSLKRHRGEPFGTQYCVYSDGPGRWRINREFLGRSRDGAPRYWDMVVMPDSQWMMLPGTLVVHSPTAPPPQGQDLPGEERSTGPILDRLLTGGLAAAKGLGLRLGDVQLLSDNRFRVAASRRDVPEQQQLTLEYIGRWDAERGRGFIESRTLVQNGYKPDSTGETYSMRDWRFVPEIGRWAAGFIAWAPAQGALGHRVRLIGGLEGDPDTLQRITRVPEIDGSDPLRGPVTATRLVDHRPGRRSLQIDPDGTRSTLDLPAEAGKSTAFGALRLIGWIIGSATLFGLGLLIYQRVLKR